MLPIQLNRDNANGEAIADGITTPLRGGVVRLPRLRLLDKHFKLETVPIYASRKERSNPIRSFVHRNKNGGIIPETQCSADRFIPRRKGLNLEAAYHSLVQAKTPKKTSDRATLDLPNDLNCMGFAWQKHSMARALQTIIPGTGYQQILQLSIPNTTPFLPTVIGSRAGRPRHFEEPNDAQDEYKWPVRPRRHPVIGPPDTILDIPHFRPSIRKSLLDWSSKNMIAAVIDNGSRHGVCVVNGDVTLNTDDTQFLFHDKCTAVKFSNSGNEIAIGRNSSVTSVYRMNPNKVAFTFHCDVADHPFPCQPQAYAWSKNDQYIVAGCSGGYLAVSHVLDSKNVKIMVASTSEIVSVSFSPNDRYIACCGREPSVRIFTWPDLIPFMEIGYCVPVRAMAWHPWESSVLCIGGGMGDGGISIWNVQRHTSLVFRSINFTGTVDTLGWNKVTGELMVNWFVRERDQCYVAMPIYASFDRITDAIIPTVRKNRVLYTAWSPDGSQIACQARESVFMYNFLDKKSKERVELRKKVKDKSTKSISFDNLRTENIRWIEFEDCGEGSID